MSSSGHYLKSELYKLVREDPSIFEFLQSGSLDGIWYWDLENIENEWMSPHFWTTLGYDPKEKRHLASEWQDMIHPDDLQVALDNFKKHCADPNHPYDQNVRYRHQDGSTVWVRCRGLAIRDELGKPIRMLGAHTDLTAQKKVEEELRLSEERFRVLFDNAPLPYQSLDDNGFFVEVNLKWLKILGYRREEVVGKSFADFLHPDWIDHFKMNFPRFKSIGEILGVEFELRKKDGTYIWVTFDGQIRRDNDGSFIQTHCVFKDITDQRKLEKKIKQQEEALRQAQKMESIGNLAGGIAHDFNNILASVIGFTELALDEAKQGTTLEDNLQEVYMAGKRAKDLVKQILTFARQTNEEIRPVQISKIIRDSLTFLRSSIPTTIGIKHELNSDSLTLGNATLIEQTIINLATNSMHAMEEGGGVLTVRLSDVHIDEITAKKQHLIKPGDYIQIAISDTGTGIPPELIESVFEPYFTTKETGKGTGMGLSLVHGTIKKYGGAIKVESRLGHGTTFTILLPITKKREKTEPYQPSELPQGMERILFVDDELPISKMAKQLLEKLGYDVTTRSSSVEALELFKAKPNSFDLVVTDMTMPNLTGDKLAVELIKIRRDIPIILCTGYSKKISDETASEIGIKAFAYKPVVKADLAKTVRKVLDEAKGVSHD